MIERSYLNPVPLGRWQEHEIELNSFLSYKNWSNFRKVWISFGIKSLRLDHKFFFHTKPSLEKKTVKGDLSLV